MLIVLTIRFGSALCCYVCLSIHELPSLVVLVLPLPLSDSFFVGLFARPSFHFYIGVSYLPLYPFPRLSVSLYRVFES